MINTITNHHNHHHNKQMLYKCCRRRRRRGKRFYSDEALSGPPRGLKFGTVTTQVARHESTPLCLPPSDRSGGGWDRTPHDLTPVVEIPVGGDSQERRPRPFKWLLLPPTISSFRGSLTAVFCGVTSPIVPPVDWPWKASAWNNGSDTMLLLDPINLQKSNVNGAVLSLWFFVRHFKPSTSIILWYLVDVWHMIIQPFRNDMISTRVLLRDHGIIRLASGHGSAWEIREEIKASFS